MQEEESLCLQHHLQGASEGGSLSSQVGRVWSIDCLQVLSLKPNFKFKMIFFLRATYLLVDYN